MVVCVPSVALSTWSASRATSLQIDADVSEVEIGRFYKLSNITPPEGTSFPYPYDFNLYTVVGKRVAT